MKHARNGIPRRTALAMFATALLAGTAGASSWRPSQPVRIVVPFAAGGPSDTIARIVADEMTTVLGEPIYIENISGEGGRTGVLRFLDEARDGHTLIMGHMGTHGAAPSLTGNLGYDPMADFAPVGLAAGTPLVICASRKINVRTIDQLKEFVAANRGRIRMAHAGRGSVSHAGGLLLDAALKIEPTFVAYAGTGPALNDIVSGDIDLIADQIVNVLPAITARKIVPLAIASRERSPILSGVPTVGEIGLEGMRVDAWNALFAKAGTPPEQIAALHEALRIALGRPATRARLFDLGAEIPDEASGTSEALRRLVEDETRRWAALLHELRGNQVLR